MIEDFYISCIRKRPTESQDTGTGEVIQTFTNTTINGYKGSQAFTFQKSADKLTTKTQYKFFTDDFNIRFGDIVNYENEDYLVISDTENTAHLNHHALVYIEKYKNIT